MPPPPEPNGLEKPADAVPKVAPPPNAGGLPNAAPPPPPKAGGEPNPAAAVGAAVRRTNINIYLHCKHKISLMGTKKLPCTFGP